MDDDWYPPERPALPQGPEHYPPTGPNSLAGFWNRAGARALDSVLIGVPVLLVAFNNLVQNGKTDSTTLPRWAAPIWFVAAVAYEVAMVSWRGQTLGKMAAGIRVARVDNGRCPFWWQAALRIMVPAVFACLPFQPACALYLGEYLTGFWDPTRRALHDKAAGTVVVSTR